MKRSTMRLDGKFALLLLLTGANVEAQAQLPEPELAKIQQREGILSPQYYQGLRKLKNRNGIQAIPKYRELLSAQKEKLGATHLDVARTAAELGLLYFTAQPRSNDAGQNAIAFSEEALAIRKQLLGADDPLIVESLKNLGVIYRWQKRSAEEEAIYRELLSIQKQTLGDDHLAVAGCLTDIATSLRAQNRIAEAESLARHSLVIRRKALGDDHADVLDNMILLYDINERLRRFDEAQAALDQVAANQRQDQMGAFYRHLAFWHRASLEWNQGRRSEALTYLKKALDVSEDSLANHRGYDDGRRKALFTDRLRSLEQLILWQVQLGDLNEAFSAVERHRGFSLHIQLNAAQLNLFEGMSDAEAQGLRLREQATLTRIANAETTIRQLTDQKDLDVDRKEAELKRYELETTMAKGAYEQVRQEIRNASPVYQRAMKQSQHRISLPTLQEWVDRQEALLVEYAFIGQQGFVFVVAPHAPPRLEKLTLSREQATTLGIMGLTFGWHQSSQALSASPKTGVLKLLADPKRNGEAQARMAALWSILFPEPERKGLREGKYRRLIIIPDGPLAAFPFETLAADAVGAPEYLLDFGPPIEYAPSATILYDLAQRKSAVASSSKKEPVLSVAIANYDDGVAQAGNVALATQGARSAYRRCGGVLSNLPGAKRESEWLVDNFRREAIPVKLLVDADAGEAFVRADLSGRRFLHFACHGLVDDTAGNLFGALALAPSSATDPADDGFLTLAEIYGLDLKGCELALLSACETNLGKLQEGEGVSALSRGFLVAGARRVVASNWVVSDDATPSLVSYFCALIAQAEKEGRTPDYAAALQESKRWLRQHPQWSQPYYWAPLVLIGPR